MLFVFILGVGKGGGGHLYPGQFSFPSVLLLVFYLSLSSLRYEEIPPLLIMMRGIVIVHASDSIVVMYNSSLCGDAGISSQSIFFPSSNLFRLFFSSVLSLLLLFYILAPFISTAM
ncbi:hypothetical protein V8C35DRAFT_104378 [Trichoderma chlorosporum]